MDGALVFFNRQFIHFLSAAFYYQLHSSIFLDVMVGTSAPRSQGRSNKEKRLIIGWLLNTVEAQISSSNLLEGLGKGWVLSMYRKSYKKLEFCRTPCNYNNLT